jgi:hypothetical protein
MTLSLTATLRPTLSVVGAPILLPSLAGITAAVTAAGVSATAAAASQTAAAASASSASTSATTATTQATASGVSAAAAAADAATLAASLAADVLVKTATSGFSAERVVTDTTEIAVDWATAAQAKFGLASGVVDAQTLVTAVATDHVLIADASDSNNKKKALISDIVALNAAASQAEQETATSTTVYVSPGRQQYHPSAAKGWINFNGTGTVAIRSSYNVTSLTDNGTGDYTVTWDIDFSNANYAIIATVGRGAGAATGFFALAPDGADSAAGTTRIRTIDTTFNLADASWVSVVVFGDQ